MSSNKTNYKSLCISGGSIKGFLMLGCLQYLFEENIIKEIQNFSGTSVGSILCYLICIGYQPIEILSYITTNKVLEKLKNMDIINFINKKGLLDFNIIHEHLLQMTLNKTGKELKMSDIKNDYGKNLYITTYNITLNKEELISCDTHPDLNCLTAIRMSCNVPLLFSDFKYNEYHYIDGAYSNNFPIEVLDKKDIIGITIDYDIKYNFENNDNDNNIFSYISYLMLLENYKKQKNKINNILENNPTCKIYTIKSNFPSFNFSIDSPKKLDLFSEGYKGIRNYFNSNS